MKSIRLVLLFSFLVPVFLYAQNSDTRLIQHTYTYSFDGGVDSSSVQQIAYQIQKLPGVYKVKGHFKPEKNAGEFIIFTLYNFKANSEENHDPFNPTQLKKLLIDNKLLPKDFRLLR